MNKFILLIPFICFSAIGFTQSRFITDFDKQWKFALLDDSNASKSLYDDSKWRTLDLPHDWSIEGSFSNKYPTTFNEGALPAGIGWYRKKFSIPVSSKDKRVFINFDGVYKNSEVWINGNYLGKRPNGYISFRYELTSFLKFGNTKNIISVRVDNSEQPDSRWYTGSGIYRNVWLLTTNKIAVDQWGTFVTTTKATKEEAWINIATHITNTSAKTGSIKVSTQIYDADGKLVITANAPSKQILIAAPETNFAINILFLQLVAKIKIFLTY